MRHRLGSLLAVAGLVVGAVLVVSAAPASPAPVGDGEVPGSWIVELRPGQDPRTEAPRLARENGGTVGHVYTAALQGFSFRGTEGGAEALARNPKVRRVEADRLVQATAATGVQRIDAVTPTGAPHPDLAGTNGAGITVAILDTGIDTSHPILAGRASWGYDCTGEGQFDGHGHGTHVAGTVAGSNGYGVAPGASVVAVKVLDSRGSGTWAGVICGVDWVTKSGAEVANMSLGGGTSETGTACSSSTLHQAICNSVAAGVTYAVAAGNSSVDASQSVPARYPEVVTVSAYEDRDGVACTPGTACEERIASFSNYGASVDVTAPGVAITSSLPGGSYGTWSGTSMATPHVAGVAALVLSDTPLSPAAVADRLKTTGACPDGSLAAAGCGGMVWPYDQDTTAEPLINAVRAVGATAPDPGPDQPPVASFTSACADLSCTFTSTSTDDNGIASRSWTFGDGATGTASPATHVYAAAGTYTVVLTVTDTAGATATDTKSVTVTAPSPIALSARGYRQKGAPRVDLTWSGATTTSVDVYRNGVKITTTANDGAHTDALKKGGGTYTYKVCAAGTQTCSNTASVTF